jgi:hypothetical protein
LIRRNPSGVAARRRTGRRQVGQHLELFAGPGHATGGVEPRGQAGRQLDQVRDVGQGVGLLPRGQRPLRPVVALAALVELDAEEVAQERL